MSAFRRGDAHILINGETRTLRLTLGALAELEDSLGQGDFEALQKRLAAPRIADLLVILRALLQGGGFLISIEQLKAADIDLSAAAKAVAEAFAALTPVEARA